MTTIFASLPTLCLWLDCLSPPFHPKLLVQAHEEIRAKATKYAEEHGFLFAESSAKKDVNVKKVFKMVVSEIHAAHLKQYERHRDSVMLKSGTKAKAGGGEKTASPCAGCGM